MNDLDAKLKILFSGTEHCQRTFFPKGVIQAGMGGVGPGSRYEWDGLKRKPHQGYLFQYTLEGWGEFETRGRRHLVTPGRAFSARIPSAHRYRSVPDCPRWRFFWIMVRHDYFTQRVFRNDLLLNRVVEFPPASGPLLAIPALLKQVVAGDSIDPFALEESLLLWMLELDRWAFSQRHPSHPRKKLLEWAQGFSAERMDRNVSVEEMAGAYGLTRSNFAHHFRKVTGLTPASFLREQRLAQAAWLLRGGQYSVKEVAARTGFSNANQLCKIFRAHFQISPGSYRQLRQ